MGLLDWFSHRLAAFLSKSIRSASVSTASFDSISTTLRPGDVLLVEGDTRISVVIQYMTQSTWSHAALYLGPDAGLPCNDDGDPHVLVEADLEAGIRTIPLSCYRHMHTRICRPVGLRDRDIRRMTIYALSRIGDLYDLKNVVDLARYLFPTPPIPRRHRRRMMALGSGDPTKAICSSFIAEAFQHIRYPILPYTVEVPDDHPCSRYYQRDCYQIRNHTLFAPRDFDASPYFQIIKPSLAPDFDYRKLPWVGG